MKIAKTSRIPTISHWSKELDYDGPVYRLSTSPSRAYVITRNAARTGWYAETNVGGRHTYVTAIGQSSGRKTKFATTVKAVAAVRRHYNLNTVG